MAEKPTPSDVFASNADMAQFIRDLQSLDVSGGKRTWTESVDDPELELEPAKQPRIADWVSFTQNSSVSLLFLLLS